MSDETAMMAYAMYLADHSGPDCRCKVETGYEPATPENGAIRDMHWIKTDPSACEIERHRNPWGKW